MLRIGRRLTDRCIRHATGPVSLSGFRDVNKFTVHDLKLEVREMEHEKTKAKWIHIDKENEAQKVFNICFRTVPMTDNGVAHILEHIVLCGSAKYPVRDPFFKMINRSLNSFMNAMTGTDYTMYPFATGNEQDFQNLLSVYLDAVFRPNLRHLDFLQEAWRLGEGNDGQENDLVFKGVVFNEMKGAMSDADQIFFRRLIGSVCPSHTYQYNSGGEPLAIPSLTYEELKKFHADHYNPMNSQIITYGDINLDSTSAQLSDALNSVPPGHKAETVPKEPIFKKPRYITFDAPWNKSAQNLEKQSTACIAWSVCDRNDVWQNFVGGLIGSLLADGASSPLYKDLIESGLGSEFAPGTGFWTYLKDSMFSAGLREVKETDLDKVHEMVIKSLERAADEGFPQDRIEALIHQLELTTRHQTVKFGLGLTFNLHPALLHGADMKDSLETLSMVDRLRKELAKNPNYLRDQIRPMILDNPHKAYVKMIPKEDYEDRQAELESQLLKEHLSKLSASDKRECFDLEVDLETEQAETPNVECLPTLTINDISPDKQRFPPTQTDNLVHYQKMSGSGLTYIRGLIELDLEDSELDLIPIYESILTRIGRGGFDYRQIETEQAMVSGGLSVSSGILTDYNNAQSARPALNFYTYGLDSNLEKILGLLDSLLNKDGPDFTPDRIKTVLTENYSRVQGGIVGSGHTYSMAHSHSYINSYGNINERLGGLTAIQNMKSEIAAEDFTDLAGRLQKLHEKICSQYMRFLIHSDSDQTNAVLGLSGLSGRQAAGNVSSGVYVPESEVNKSSWDLGFPINYVSRAFPTVSSSHPDSAPLSILASMMSAKYLLREIREAGGAYGAGANHNGGAFRFFSYRDPTGLGTLSKFSTSVDWVLKQKWTKRDVHEAILKVFQTVDSPVSQSNLGVGIWKENLDVAQLDNKRAQLLSVTEADLLRVAETYLVNPGRQADTIIGPTEAPLKEGENFAVDTSSWKLRTL